MGKNKLKRFEENKEFLKLVQPVLEYPPVDYELKGHWKENFFHNNNRMVIELGCGRGEYTVSLAELYPAKNFIGIDWKGARLWRGAKTVHEENLLNAGFLRIQIQNIHAFFGKDEVSEIWITFPDPQMESSREKKRLTNPRYLDIYRQFVTRDGIIHLKTDNLPFYEYTLKVIQQQHLCILESTDDLYLSGIADEVLSIKTTYEKIWLRKGSKICYLKFKLFED